MVQGIYELRMTNFPGKTIFNALTRVLSTGGGEMI